MYFCSKQRSSVLNDAEANTQEPEAARDRGEGRPRKLSRADESDESHEWDESGDGESTGSFHSGTGSGSHRSEKAADAASDGAGAKAQEQITFGVFRSALAENCDAVLGACTINTLLDFAKAICRHILKYVRDPAVGGNKVNEHLWYLQFGVETAEENCVRWLGSQLGTTEDNMPPPERISLAVLPFKLGTWVRFRYDMGTTTEVFFKVLLRGPVEGKVAEFPQVVWLDRQMFGTAGLMRPARLTREVLTPFTAKYFHADAIPEAQCAALLAEVSAMQTLDSQKLDTLFPALSAKILFSDNVFTLGMTCKGSSEVDVMFSTLHTGYDSFMVAPCFFTDVTEFLIIAEQTCRTSFANIQGGGHEPLLFVVPSNISPEQAAHVEPGLATGEIRAYRQTPAQLAASKSQLASVGFSFAGLFPQTHKQLTSGRFRWFVYNSNVLRVCVGRATGEPIENAPPENVLREWHGPFKSFHELMCAVEASWVLRQPDGSLVPLDEQVLPVDLNLSPSHPQRRVPPMLCDARAAVRLAEPGATACVISLALSRDARFLYSGHGDGRIGKWDVAGRRQVWLARAFFETPVLGLIADGDEQVVCWSYTNEIRVIDGACGATLHSFISTVGGTEEGAGADEDDEEEEASVNCVVLAMLPVTATPIVIAGLHLVAVEPASLRREAIVEAQRKGPGNIVVFDRRSRQVIDTWRGHAFPVTALAVSPDGRYLVSVASAYCAINMILWDLTNPGVPAQRLEFYNPVCSLEERLRVKTIRDHIDTVCGINIVGDHLFLFCNRGNVLHLMELRGFRRVKAFRLDINQYEDAFHFLMASYGSGLLCMAQTASDALLLDGSKLISGTTNAPSGAVAVAADGAGAATAAVTAAGSAEAAAVAATAITAAVPGAGRQDGRSTAAGMARMEITSDKGTPLGSAGAAPPSRPPAAAAASAAMDEDTNDMTEMVRIARPTSPMSLLDMMSRDTSKTKDDVGQDYHKADGRINFPTFDAELESINAPPPPIHENTVQGPGAVALHPSGAVGGYSDGTILLMPLRGWQPQLPEGPPGIRSCVPLDMVWDIMPKLFARGASAPH